MNKKKKIIIVTVVLSIIVAAIVAAIVSVYFLNKTEPLKCDIYQYKDLVNIESSIRDKYRIGEEDINVYGVSDISYDVSNRKIINLRVQLIIKTKDGLMKFGLENNGKNLRLRDMGKDNETEPTKTIGTLKSLMEPISKVSVKGKDIMRVRVDSNNYTTISANSGAYVYRNGSWRLTNSFESGKFIKFKTYDEDTSGDEVNEKEYYIELSK